MSDKNPWQIVVVGSSHNDIGWAGTPSEIAEHREHRIIDGVFDLLAKDPDYVYAVEASLYADEYLDRNPQRAEYVRDLVASGRLEWGGTYIQPYEGLYSGEDLLRQVEHGRKSMFDKWGIRSRGAWNVDVQGRTKNLAQIYKSAGLDYLVVSRCKPGLYWWEAVDGSRLLVLSLMQGHYGYPFLNTRKLHSSPLESDVEDNAGFDIATAAARLRDLTERFEPMYEEHKLPRIMLVCVTSDYTVPDKALSQFIETWNDQSEHIASAHGIDAKLEYGTADSYVRMMEESGTLDNLPVVRGEMPNPWLYIHGPGHHKTVDALRRGASALVTAEQLHALRGTSASGLAPAWKDHIYIDHGFGGLHGIGTDEVFRFKAETAEFAALASIELSLTEEAAELGLGNDQVLVYNPLSVPRGGWFEVEISTTRPLDGLIGLTAADGTAVVGHVLSQEHPAGSNSGRARIGVVLPEMPALGYTVLDVEARDAVERAHVSTNLTEDFVWTNEHYNAVVTRGGIRVLRLASHSPHVVDSGSYLLGETIILDSPGIDVGTHEQDGKWDYKIVEPYQPQMVDFRRTGNTGTDPQIVFQSSDATRVVTEAPLAGAIVRNTYTFYRDLPHFDMSVDVLGWDGSHGRELRVCFPFYGDLASSSVTYDVPFGDVTVGEDEIEEFSEMRPREVQNWIRASNEQSALTVSGSVIAWDWQDVEPTNQSVVLQAILLATKRSCHAQGSWYSQRGDHHAEFRVDATGLNVDKATILGWDRAFPLRARRGSSENSQKNTVEVPDNTGDSPWFVPDSSDVLLTCVRPLENGDLLLRFWEHAGNESTISTAERPKGSEVYVTDPFGDNPEPLQGDDIKISAHGLVSVVVRGTR